MIKIYFNIFIYLLFYKISLILVFNMLDYY